MGLFHECDPDTEAARIFLHATAPMQLAHHFSSAMSARGKGGVIFVASTMGFQGFPYSANYAATKAYLLSLGEALHYELKPTGVIVTVLSPGPTDTPMSKAIASAHDLDASKMPIESMDVEPVVAEGLKGLRRGRVSVVPGWLNKVIVTVGGSNLLSRS